MPILNVNEQHKAALSFWDRTALWITANVGTMGFFSIIVGWTVGWLGWNVLAPKNVQFDPYPAFVLWLFISNVIQIILMPLILIGQNLQGRYAELRAEADFEINIKAEREIEAVLKHLEAQDDMIIKILARLEVGVTNAPAPI